VALDFGAEHGTLRSTSKELGMTQPAATKMIQELRVRPGPATVERAGCGQKLTAAGTVCWRTLRMRGSAEATTSRTD
jgi:DNA-binding transcriptional LysR family regulator